MNPSYPGTRVIDKKHNQGIYLASTFHCYIQLLDIAKELGPCPKGGSHELKSH
ncbi:16886_t:CDS:2 [Entrophospora sp. SA101]|nr:16886_t:CDS:2 [Entrophospora sp. SA101]